MAWGGGPYPTQPTEEELLPQVQTIKQLKACREGAPSPEREVTSLTEELSIFCVGPSIPTTHYQDGNSPRQGGIKRTHFQQTSGFVQHCLLCACTGQYYTGSRHDAKQQWGLACGWFRPQNAQEHTREFGYTADSSHSQPRTGNSKCMRKTLINTENPSRFRFSIALRYKNAFSAFK